MRRTHKLIFGIASATIIPVALFGVVSAQSQTITTNQINRIRVNCVSAKNTLAQLQTNDALLRVNRGQLYEYMTTKLMGRFNTRVENNRLNAKSLVAVTNYYDKLLNTFRADYQAYAEQLAKTLSIDCTKDSAKFYNSVLEARDRRKQVHTDVVRLHQNIGEYKSALDAFVINFNKNSGV